MFVWSSNLDNYDKHHRRLALNSILPVHSIIIYFSLSSFQTLTCRLRRIFDASLLLNQFYESRTRKYSFWNELCNFKNRPVLLDNSKVLKRFQLFSSKNLDCVYFYRNRADCCTLGRFEIANWFILDSWAIKRWLILDLLALYLKLEF